MCKYLSVQLKTSSAENVEQSENELFIREMLLSKQLGEVEFNPSKVTKQLWLKGLFLYNVIFGGFKLTIFWLLMENLKSNHRPRWDRKSSVNHSNYPWTATYQKNVHKAQFYEFSLYRSADVT